MNNVMEGVFKHADAGIDVVKWRRENPLPELPKTISSDQFLSYLHEDMRQAYMSGLDHSAIVTACALLEASLKAALYFYHDLENGRVFDQKEWDRIDGLTFYNLHEELLKKNRISQAVRDALSKFRETIRNKYMHAETPPEVKQTKLTVFQGDFSTGQGGMVEVPLETNLSLQRMQRIFVDRENCWQVVEWVDRAVRNLLKTMDALLVEWEKHNPSPKPTKEQIDAMFKKMSEAGLTPSMAITRHLPTV